MNERESAIEDEYRCGDEERISMLTISKSNSSSSSTSNLERNNNTLSSTTSSSPSSNSASNTDLLKLTFGAGGIYAAFLYYGSLQEDVFRYTAKDGSTFQQVWFLQSLEALANVIVGYFGMTYCNGAGGRTKNIPLKMFAVSGVAQVLAKTFTSLALANGLSFPVATLAKSAKMAPVMAGSLLLGGATYTLREYMQVLAIIGGTAIVNFGGKKHESGTSTILGLVCILGSLSFDGVTAGFQKRLQVETAKVNCKPKPYDFMFWTNFFMCITATTVALILGEITSGILFCIVNPAVFLQILQFAVCSAVGQSFIFYTLANFDPLILSTVTTTRKIFSVLLSIFFKGHNISITGWFGVTLACLGIASELKTKSSSTSPKKSHR